MKVIPVMTVSLIYVVVVVSFFKFKRQREGKASPLRHSKDDSDTIDLAPSHFPPLPTSPLPLFVSILAYGWHL